MYYAQDAQAAHWLRKMRKLRIGCAINAQGIYAQDLRKLGLSFVNLQDLRNILSPTRNICVRFVQDSLPSPMRNIFPRLYCFLQCAIYAQDCTYFPNAQYLRKVVLLSAKRNVCARLYIFPQCAMCARFSPDCTSFPNVLGPLTIYAQKYIITHQVTKFSIFLSKSTGQTKYNKEKTDQIRCDFF